ncbi:NADP-dependent oxidoreductase domain-containing protein [Sphaerosporella brunnea]|uniref:NADP-dependent oxidoreductase domain-containing protein n=1 Tax=Sphaerosporella brunnea TaxID=1250544 RepID=A0A5J5EVJ2_9PEZI|nr:NADP-dependent oxidoreductase domain-containing protein [Sphaerosporella brunnea]
MEYRRLGRSGLKVSVISLGGWLTYGGHVEEEKTYDCLKIAYDHGINFFDTAEGYGGGQSEVVMGKAIRKFGWNRCDIVISTKINFGAANSAHKSRSQNTVGLSRKHVVEGLRASLDRLGLEYVDLVYAHRPDRLTPMEEVVRAFNHVIERGWAFYWGTSEWTAEEIADAWRVADRLNLIGPLMEQPQYNLLHREKVEKEFAPLYKRHGLGLTTFSPLKFGILSGKYNGATIPADSRFGENHADLDPFIKSFRAKFETDAEMKQQLAISQKLEVIAKELDISQAALSLAWILKNKNISSIITGASKPEQVVENVKAIQVVEKLTPEVMKKIEEAISNKPADDPVRYGMPEESLGVTL